VDWPGYSYKDFKNIKNNSLIKELSNLVEKHEGFLKKMGYIKIYITHFKS